ncbi:MAG: class II aldolase/adducin family protein [Silvanigrellaceae bacterium]
MRSERKYRFDASGQIALSLFEQIKLGNLCDVAARLDNRHAIPATSSNFSLRRDPSSFLISRSGKHKRDLTPGDFLLVDLAGNACAPIAPKASDETLLHALVYEKCPWVGCILHCHAPELENLRPPSVKIAGHELLKALGTQGHTTPLVLKVYENNQDMRQLANDIEAKQFAEPSEKKGPVLFMLSQHGIYCGGETVEKSEAYLEALLHLVVLHEQKSTTVSKEK